MRPLASPPQRSGLTLLELLVALVLSALLWALILPLLRAVTHPAAAVVPGRPTWYRAVAADLRQIVSPAKCALPVVRVIPPSNDDPMPQLLIETFCRIPPRPNEAPLRGPSEVRYQLEPAGAPGFYALVRSARGWHDALADRVIVAQDIERWTLVCHLPETAPETQPQDKTPVPALPVALAITVLRAEGAQRFQLAVPQVQRDPSDPTSGGTP